MVKAKKNSIEAKFAFKDNKAALKLLQKHKLPCQGLNLIIIKHKVVDQVSLPKENYDVKSKMY